MATIVDDIVENVKWKETNGRVVAITRGFLVSDMPGPETFSNDEVMAFALTRVPRSRSKHPVEDHLIITSRSPRWISTKTVMVMCDYTLPSGGSFDTPPGQMFSLSGGTSIEEIETQLYRLDQGMPPAPQAGDQIKVSYQGEERGALVNVFEARAVLSFSAQFQSQAPWALPPSWVNTVNSGGFFYSPGAPARTWLITDLNFSLDNVNTSPFPQYTFNLNMRQNPNGVDPQVVWIASSTGQPPKDLVAGEGYFTIKHYDESNFDGLFT